MPPIFSFHIAKSTLAKTAKTLMHPPAANSVPGLYHAECMTVMALGSPILSKSRFQLSNLAVFAKWENEIAIDAFLKDTELGEILSTGWYVHLGFIRRWGHISELGDLPTRLGNTETDEPVVAVTLARLKLPEAARFIRWGKPVEELVRDHPGSTFALAAMRLPRTVSTFSVWHSQRAMLDMVHGQDSVPGEAHHASAMRERERKNFHHEFTTLRFKAIKEVGAWEGRCNIIPK